MTNHVLGFKMGSSVDIAAGVLFVDAPGSSSEIGTLSLSFGCNELLFGDGSMRFERL